MITIEPFPEHGINLHVIRQARICQLKGIPPDQAIRLIYQAGTGNLRRPWQHREVERAVETVYATTCPTLARPKAPKPKWRPDTLAHVQPFTLDELRESSPFPRPWENHQHEFVRALFPASGALLCIGRDATKFRTATIEEHGREAMATAALVVPCYMTARSGLTKENKPSAHSLENTGPRRFIVCDFDEPKPEDHPRIIRHLAKYRRLVAVVSSGGKSLHAWFPAYGEDADKTFWRGSILHGADPAIMQNRSSFVRMPGGLRENGNRQVIHYFDMEAANKIGGDK